MDHCGLSIRLSRVLLVFVFRSFGVLALIVVDFFLHSLVFVGWLSLGVVRVKLRVRVGPAIKLFRQAEDVDVVGVDSNHQVDIACVCSLMPIALQLRRCELQAGLGGCTNLFEDDRTGLERVVIVFSPRTLSPHMWSAFVSSTRRRYTGNSGG